MWPEDVREYFGDGDECHMAYHFPLMPRMYMAIAQEDRHPVVEILQQTPEIPESCQWAIFLRNHDELTLEMVTSKERDYMYSMYAADRGAHQPGHPAPAGAAAGKRPRTHQADEQPAAVDARFAGALLRRRDRHGRQHLPRRPRRRAHADAMDLDRNGGFSRADPQRLYLPPIQDPVYGYEAVNVEAQLACADVAAQLDAAHAGGAPAPLRPSGAALHAAAPGQPQGAGLPARVRATSSCAWPTSAARHNRWNWIWRRFKGRVPVEMMGRNAFRRSPNCPTADLAGHGFLLVSPEHR
jgi:maltose alpha-D-glucosyltransferase/alpha-amylase